MGSLGSSSAHVVPVEELLNALEPCLFPRLDDGVSAPKSEHQVHVGIQATVPELFSFCAKIGIQVPDLVKSAWAVVLGSYVGSVDVSFGVSSIVLGERPEMKQSICNTTINSDATIRTLLQRVRESGQVNQTLDAPEFHLAFNKVTDPVFNTEILFSHDTTTLDTAAVSQLRRSSNSKVKKPQKSTLLALSTDMEHRRPRSLLQWCLLLTR